MKQDCKPFDCSVWSCILMRANPLPSGHYVMPPMFGIMVFRRSAMVVLQHSEKHQGTTLQSPGLTAALNITVML